MLKSFIAATLVLASFLASAETIRGSYILEQNDCLPLPLGTQVSVNFNAELVTLSKNSVSGEVIVEHFFVGEKKVPLQFGAVKYVGSFTENSKIFTSTQYQVNPTDPDRLITRVRIIKTQSGLFISKERKGDVKRECVFSEM